MGYKRKKICSTAGCSNIAIPNSAYCEKHQKEVNRSSTSKYDSFYHKQYWKKARKQFLLKNFWCEECLKKGKHTLADTVHHSKGFNSWETFCDKRYWVAICGSCHSIIHKRVTNDELYNQNKDKW